MTLSPLQKPSTYPNAGWALDNFCKISSHIVFFAESLGREKYIFFKQHYKQMMTVPLQSHAYKFYATFHVFNFRQDETNGVHDVNVISLKSIYM